MARNCLVQNLTDHWPVVTRKTSRGKKEKWKHSGNSNLKGWRPKTVSEESGFGKVIVENLEAAEDEMREFKHRRDIKKPHPQDGESNRV